MNLSDKLKGYFINEKKMVLTPESIASKIKTKDFFHADRLAVDKSLIGKDENERLNHNLFAVARNNANVKSLVVDLVNQGYFLIQHKEGISIFEKYVSAEKFKRNLTNENLQTFKDLFYTLQEPRIKSSKPRLLVVFSSVADFSMNASVSRRNFFTNFKSVFKYVPSNTYVLRISDIGSVVGSFYLNNRFNSKVEEHVQELLSHILEEKNILKADVVLYGASKGATASLYHGIKGEYNAVCVDPIVSDEYHERKYNDPHFTIGTFPLTKQEKFSRLLKEREINSNVNIIYSENSPIYDYINAIIKDGDVSKKINYINVVHPKIKDHPDVGPNTIDVLTTLINNLYYNLAQIKSKRLVMEALD